MEHELVHVMGVVPGALTAATTPADDPIGVFDSGVGGLSILRELRRQLPHEYLLYAADSKYAPYGERDRALIERRAEAIVQFLVNQGVKAIVVACNTATSVAVEGLRSRFSLPIVAIEPALKPAAVITKSGVVGVLATSRTLSSERFDHLVTQHGQGVRVLTQACPGLVEQVEKGELSGPATRSLIEHYLSPLLQQGVDTLVLGCTHYPFLVPAIKDVAGPGVSIIDPSEAVIRHLVRQLTGKNLISLREVAGTESFYTSGSEVAKETIAKLWSTPAVTG